MTEQPDDRQTSLKRGIRVEIASHVYDILEGMVSVTLSLLAGRRLGKTKLNSTIETISAVTLICDLKRR